MLEVNNVNGLRFGGVVLACQLCMSKRWRKEVGVYTVQQRGMRSDSHLSVPTFPPHE